MGYIWGVEPNPNNFETIFGLNSDIIAIFSLHFFLFSLPKVPFHIPWTNDLLPKLFIEFLTLRYKWTTWAIHQDKKLHFGNRAYDQEGDCIEGIEAKMYEDRVGLVNRTRDPD